MTNEVVSRKEFENLEKKVNELEDTIMKNSDLLNQIDKKVDGILIKLEDRNTINDLTLKPLNERVTKVEDNQKWVWRTIVVALILEGLNILSSVSKMLKWGELLWN
mgnify:CR=1 FL=1